MVKTREPWRTKPSCSFSWWCSGTALFGARSTTARVIRSPLTTRAWTSFQILYGLSSASGRKVLLNFAVDDRRSAEPATAAHRLQAVAQVAPLELEQEAVHQDRA